MSLTVSVIICCYTEERLQDIRDAVATAETRIYGKSYLCSWLDGWLR